MGIEGRPTRPRPATETIPPPPPESAEAPSLHLHARAVERYDGTDESERMKVEQVMLRTGAFFVHSLNEHAELRHNANSNVSAETTVEDDLDNVLAFESSISASSIQSGADEEGKVNGLWSQTGGVLISGGQVSAASEDDIGSLPNGLKKRWVGSSAVATGADVDRVVMAPKRSTHGALGGYNEFVIDSPEVSGYFKFGELDENGNAWVYGTQTKERLEELHRLYQESPSSYSGARKDFDRSVDRYRARFELAKRHGLPFYMLTPDRRFFEVKQVNDNGTLTLGEELTPEVAAKAPAGISSQDRKELGRRLLDRGIFRKKEDEEEARRILDAL